MKTDTHGGIIMCSEFCALQLVQQCNAYADNHKNNISGIQFVKEKASATTINTASMQSKRKTFYGDLAGANDSFLRTSRTESVLNKTFSSKHLPN